MPTNLLYINGLPSPGRYWAPCAQLSWEAVRRYNSYGTGRKCPRVRRHKVLPTILYLLYLVLARWLAGMGPDGMIERVIDRQRSVRETWDDDCKSCCGQDDGSSVIYIYIYIQCDYLSIYVGTVGVGKQVYWKERGGWDPHFGSFGSGLPEGYIRITLRYSTILYCSTVPGYSKLDFCGVENEIPGKPQLFVATPRKIKWGFQPQTIETVVTNKRKSKIRRNRTLNTTILII